MAARYNLWPNALFLAQLISSEASRACPRHSAALVKRTSCFTKSLAMIGVKQPPRHLSSLSVFLHLDSELVLVGDISKQDVLCLSFICPVGEIRKKRKIPSFLCASAPLHASSAPFYCAIHFERQTNPLYYCCFYGQNSTVPFHMGCHHCW